MSVINSPSAVLTNCQGIHGKGPSTPLWCRHSMVFCNAYDWTCTDPGRGMPCISRCKYWFQCDCDMQCIESFLSVPEFQELRDKYHLEDDEWNALSIAQEILLVHSSAWDMCHVANHHLGSLRISTAAFCPENSNTLRRYSLLWSHDTNLETDAGGVFWKARVSCYRERSW